jgi:hypothetical protein
MEGQVTVELKPKDFYVSYSSFTSWLSCAKQYQLERILGVSALPAWYFVGGSVVHAVTEQYDHKLFEEKGI